MGLEGVAGTDINFMRGGVGTPGGCDGYNCVVSVACNALAHQGIEVLAIGQRHRCPAVIVGLIQHLQIQGRILCTVADQQCAGSAVVRFSLKGIS